MPVNKIHALEMVSADFVFLIYLLSEVVITLMKSARHYR